MMPQILSLISTAAPESSDLIKQLIDAKAKDRDILMTLLALNLEQLRQLKGINSCIVDIRVEQIKEMK